MLMELERADTREGVDQNVIDFINNGHAEVVRSTKTTIAMAIEIGRTLSMLHKSVAPGSWSTWIKSNLNMRHNVVARYIKLAENADVILALNLDSLNQVESVISTLGLPRQPIDNGMRIDINEDRVRELRASGATWRAITAELNVSPTRLYKTLHPEKQRAAEARYRAKRLARKREIAEALKRAERDKAFAKRGGDLSVAYGNLRKLLQVVDGLIAEAGDQDHRKPLREALGHLHAAEDGLVAALRAERQTT